MEKTEYDELNELLIQAPPEVRIAIYQMYMKAIDDCLKWISGMPTKPYTDFEGRVYDSQRMINHKDCMKIVERLKRCKEKTIQREKDNIQNGT